MSRIVYIAAILALSTLLTGCGIKPNDVSPPNGAPDSHFPRVYPDPTMDPRSGAAPE